MGRKKKKQSRPWCWYPFCAHPRRTTTRTMMTTTTLRRRRRQRRHERSSLLRNRIFSSHTFVATVRQARSNAAARRRFTRGSETIDFPGKNCETLHGEEACECCSWRRRGNRYTRSPRATAPRVHLCGVRTCERSCFSPPTHTTRRYTMM